MLAKKIVILKAEQVKLKVKNKSGSLGEPQYTLKPWRQEFLEYYYTFQPKHDAYPVKI